MRLFIRMPVLIAGLVACAALFGCAAVSTVKEGTVEAVRGKKEPNLEVLEEGASRETVKAELGEPKYSYEEIDIYEECKHRGLLGKVFGRGASIATGGMWKVVGTRVKKAAKMKDGCYGFIVVYDEDDRLKEVK